MLTDKEIQEWLGHGHGNGHGYGNGYGDGYGDGYGYGYGDGYGYGNGDGHGHGNGYGCGNGNGYGDGHGHGYGDGNGHGDGHGYGRGHGHGNGDGDGYGRGIKEIEEYTLYSIDSIPTAILSIKGNIARGFILVRNVYKKECYIVKENGVFAHGDTLRDAFASLQEKLYDDSTEEERIEAFKAKFPKYDTTYANEDLFTYHHVLTGSCRMGRENFCTNHGINMNGKTSVREFVKLTRDDYGGEIIQKLPAAYGITE